ncbi:MAG: RDD family protein [Spartobacteria bacterium]|nr:RDD family protein [Spartobacteria bacterium]
MQAFEKQLNIRTPEGICFPLVLASPVSRFLALAIDQACVMVLTTVLSTLLRIFNLLSPDLAAAFWAVLTFLISFGYPIVMEWSWRGQTLGKRLLRIQVMDEQGLRLQFSQVVVRNLLRPVDALPMFYLLGGVTALINRKAQRLGDITANTIVIQRRHAFEPDTRQITADKYNSLAAYPHLAARLRQYVTPEEAGIVVEALLRRAHLDAEARLTLFQALRNTLEAHVTFPAEAVENLSDENYVRNVVAILFQSR